MEKSLDASQPRRSFIPIESICIDLSSAIDRDYIGRCKSFSIREYVSKMGRKDKKICWPFTSDGNIDAIKEQACNFPPLPLQNSRSWRCLNCLKQINIKAGRKETGTVVKCCSKRCPSDGPCCQMWSTCEPSKSILGFQETLKLEVTEKREAIHDTSAFLTKSDCCASLVADKNGKTDDESDAFRKGHEEDGFEGNKSLECVELTILRAAAPEVDQCQGHERVKDDQVYNCTKCKSSPDSCQQGRSQEARNTMEHLQPGKQASGNGQDGKVTEDHEETLRMVSLADPMPHYLIDCESGNPSLGLDECDDSSSESADIGLGDGSHNHNRDKSHGLSRTRTRKMRLITDLLRESKSTTTDHIGTDYPPRNAISEPLEKTNTVVHGQAVFTELVKSRFRDQKRKRKLTSDEEGTATELMTASRESNDSLNCSGCVEDANVLLHPESKYRANAKMVPRIAIKNQTKNKYGSLKFPKKTMKQNLVIEDLSQASSRENVSKIVKDKTEAGQPSSARNLRLKLGCYTPITTRFDSIPSSDQLVETNYFPKAPARDTSSSTCKKNNKAKNENLSLIGLSNSSKRQCPITRTDAGTTSLCPPAGHLRPAEDASVEDRLALSLNSHSVVPDVKRNRLLKVEFGQASSFSKEATPKEGHIVRKSLNSGYVESNVTSTCEVDVANGILTDHNSKKATNRTPLLSDKQKNRLNLDSSTCRQMLRMDISGTSTSRKTFCPQTQCTFTNLHIDSGTEKSSEQGTLDDIPMEIVELMAKNQYERFLPDAENAEQPLKTSAESGGSQSVNITKGVRKRDWSLLLSQGNHKQKPHPKKARNHRHTMRKDYIPTKQTSVDGSSLPNTMCSNVSQMEKNCPPTGLGGILQFTEKPSSGVAFSLSGSGGHISSPYCKRNKHMVDVGLVTRGDKSSVSVDGVCDTVPQHNGRAAHLSTAIPNCVYDIPPKKLALPTTDEFLRGSRTLPVLDRVEGIGFGEHRNNSSNINAEQTQHTRQSGMDLQNLSGSTVPCSSETIPAMHLLSLMDAGTHTVNLDGNPELHQPASSSHEYHSKEIAELNFQSFKQPSNRMHPSSDYWAKGILSEHVSAVPTVDEPTPFYQPDRSFMRPTEVAAQESLKMLKKGKKNCSEVVTSNEAFIDTRGTTTRQAECIFPGSHLVTSHGSSPTLEGLRNFLDTPNNVAFPLHLNTESSRKDKLERQDRNGTLHPSQKDSEVQVCTVNKNPADFTMPEAGNRYMIGRSDLKFEKIYPFRNFLTAITRGRKSSLDQVGAEI